MKKVLFVFAVAAAMVACCGQGAKTEGCESKCAAADTVAACCDSTAAVCCDSVAAVVADSVVAE